MKLKDYLKLSEIASYSKLARASTTPMRNRIWLFMLPPHVIQFAHVVGHILSNL